MNAPLRRSSLIRFGRLLAEYRKRQARSEQAQRGYFDDHGVLQGGLMAFIRYFWHVLEPEAELKEGWALYAIVLHLEAVTFGEIKRLLINVPPGFMKSLATDVFWPAWEWGPMKLSHLRYVAFSYSSSLTERDNERFRDLIIHPSYRELWGDRFKPIKVGAVKITNDHMGWKLASSVGGVGTGERADRILCFPHATRVLTSGGWLEIGAIVEQKMDVLVAGFDQKCNSVVWQKIAEHRTNLGSELIEIVHDAGSLRCTPDHPVFVMGSGYVPAAKIRQGDALRLLRQNHHRQTERNPKILFEAVSASRRASRFPPRQQPSVQSLRNNGVSFAGSFGPYTEWPVLQSCVPWQMEPWQRQSGLSHGPEDSQLRMVRQGTRSQAKRSCAHEVLFNIMRFAAKVEQVAAQVVSDTLRLLWSVVQTASSQACLLFAGLCRQAAFEARARNGKWAIRPRQWGEGLSARVEQPLQADNQGARWLCLSSLWRTRGDAGPSRSSHRLHQEKPRPQQSHYGVQGLSRQYARWISPEGAVDRTIVRIVRSGGSVDRTFNLNVGPHHNYFADGVLVHNCDDPHNIKEAESEIVREETVRWFRESMSDRLNDMKTGVIVVIMQRAHQEDVSGTIIDLELPYCHLMIPMEYDWFRQTDNNGEPVATEIAWTDPRWVEGGADEVDYALAWPERFPEEEVTQLKAVKGPYAYHAQYQQSPSPRGGGIFKRDWWQLWDSEDGKFPVVDYVLASLDSAYTEKDSNDPSALTIWGVFVHPEHKKRRVILLHAWRKHLAFSGPRLPRLTESAVIEGIEWLPETIVQGMSEQEVRRRNYAYRKRCMPKWGLIEWTADTCRRFKVDLLLIEAKASGISAADELKNRFPDEDWGVQLVNVVGDKYARALAVQPTFSQAMVYAPVRDWSEMVIEEMEVFPKHKYRDLTDSTSQALSYLRSVGLARTDEEEALAEREAITHRPKPKALYPV